MYQLQIELQNNWGKIAIYSNTVKTLNNVTRYNRIFNIRHEFAGNRYISIEIPSL